MISYIVDEDGNRTHAVVPINEWNNIVNEKNIIKPIIKTMPVLEDLCSKKHLENILPLVKDMDILSEEEWDKEYKQFFKYMETLKYKDIYLLYLIRSDEFIYNINHCDSEDDLDRFNMYYGISRLSGVDLVISDYKELSKAVYTLGDSEFLKYFNSNYKFKNISDKKIRLDAEINRLFIFDLMERFPKCMEVEYDIRPKEAQKKLMKFLYNNQSGAKTQVQRALKHMRNNTAL